MVKTPSPCVTARDAYYTETDVTFCETATPDSDFSSPLAETGREAWPLMTLLAIGLLLVVCGLYVRDRWYS